MSMNLLNYSEYEYKLEDKNGFYTAKLQGIYICETLLGKLDCPESSEFL